ncbi:hypothetical protein G1H10_31065 [Phytoactinopolyspora halotolerans]|uniref:Uncharacterized protein n=2 Tax=Phytoactinopolyspora halotolerans TaxID=1981512 RepID=A0A6L9SHK4_9ACTN|nr:hypothetical protein [Phytoactinopolyspora halotolerans]
MQDIADLAHVSRQAVSMWRKRPRVKGRDVPFPRAVEVMDGVEHFDRDDVVAWLEETGRGNNAEVRYDAPAVAMPEGMKLEDLVVLLCVYAVAGEQLDGASRDQLLAWAQDVDPQDEFVLHEVRTLHPGPDALRYVDDLVEASYGPADALARLDNGRLKRQAAERGLTDDVIKILQVSAQACRTYLGTDETVLMHGGDRVLTLALAGDFGAVVLQGDNVRDRALRRRAAIADVGITSTVTGPSIVAASIVRLAADDALDRVDGIVLGLGPQDVAIILGSAAALCDRLRDESERMRSQTLRGENLAMAVRLPRGLWRAAHRQSLGLWVLHGGNFTQRPRIADLAAVPDGTLDLDDLASDIVGALERTDHRAFRYCRRGDLSSILAGAPVVPRGARALRIGQSDGASHVERIHAATLTTSTPLAGHDILVEQAPGAVLLRHRSLGELRDSGHIVMRRGSRVDTGHADPEGTVTVASADGNWDSVRLDPFDAERHYPRATRTEPGDVVFIEKPRPRARVDTEGGAMVASPSRILRLREAAEIGPYALAAIINEMTSEGSEWETWSVPVLSRPQAQRLDDALRDSQLYRDELRRRVDATRDLTRALIEGVAAGAVTLDAAPTTTGITTNQRKAG